MLKWSSRLMMFLKFDNFSTIKFDKHIQQFYIYQNRHEMRGGGIFNWDEHTSL